MGHILKKCLKRQKTDTFARTAVALCRTWFEDGSYDDAQRAMEEKLFRSGTYGRKEFYDENQIERYNGRRKSSRVGKIRYFLKLVFPPLSEMEGMYPILKKVAILLPVSWVLRGFRVLFHSPKRIGERYHKVISAKRDQ